MSIRGLAKKAGIARSTLHRIEIGKQEARTSQIEQIASALGMSVVEFWARTVRP